MLPQYPLTYLGLHHGFTGINIGQAAVLLPLFVFAFYMYRWENSDLVPIRCGPVGRVPSEPCAAARRRMPTHPSPSPVRRPMEGEELELRYY